MEAETEAVVAEPVEAVMVVVPTLAAVTSPAATVATLGSLLDHDTGLPVTGDPPRLRTLAEIVDVAPEARVIGVDGVRAMLAGVLSGAPSPPQAVMRARTGRMRRRERSIAANVVRWKQRDKSGRRGFRLAFVRLDWLGLRRSHRTSDSQTSDLGIGVSVGWRSSWIELKEVRLEFILNPSLIPCSVFRRRQTSDHRFQTSD
jgi:hypothetical protein